MARSLKHLSDADLEKALELFEQLVADTGRVSGKVPGAAWDSVYERLQDGLNDYRAERIARANAQSTQPSAPPADDAEAST